MGVLFYIIYYDSFVGFIIILSIIYIIMVVLLSLSSILVSSDKQEWIVLWGSDRKILVH